MRAGYTAGQNTVVIVQSAHQGVLAGLLGCVFGLLGIFTWGLIFVPLSAICALVGSFRGIAGRSITGIGCSLLAGMLAVFGFVVSPSLWMLTGAVLLTQHVSTPENASRQASTTITTSQNSPSNLARGTGQRGLAPPMPNVPAGSPPVQQPPTSGWLG